MKKIKILAVIMAVINIMLIAVPAFATVDNLPSYYDGRKYQVRVGNQGKTNNCWAYGTLSALEAYAIKNLGYSEEEANFSESHFAWFVKTKADSDDGINASPYLTGLDNEDIIEAFASGIGLVNEKDFPVYSNDISKMGNYSESDRYRHDAGVVTKAERYVKTEDIKAAIMDKGAVTANIYMNGNNVNQKTGAYYYGGRESANHMVCVVGWDDNYAISNFTDSIPSKPGAWLCKNARGPEWALGGYFWLSYDSHTVKDFFGYEMERPSYDNVYHYNGWRSENAYYDDNAQSISEANIFFSERDEYLTKIGFYIGHENVNWKIRIYTDVISVPDDGVLAYTGEINTGRSGYYTYTLEEPVKLNTRYSIVLTASMLKTNALYKSVHIPTEDTRNNCSSSAGQSFIKTDGEWKDLGDSGNVYVKAYTLNDIRFKQNEYKFDVNETFNINTLPIKRNIVWESSNTKVATVNDGIIKTIADGECDITATWNNISVSCKIAVKEKHNVIFDVPAIASGIENGKYNEVPDEIPTIVGFELKHYIGSDGKQYKVGQEINNDVTLKAVYKVSFKNLNILTFFKAINNIFAMLFNFNSYM